MWTETDEGRKLVEELSKSVVSEVAPEELDLFDELVQEYFDDPAPPDLSAQASDDALGFGMSEMLVAATPAAMAMASAVVGFVLSEAIEADQEESVGLVLKRLFKKGKVTDEGPPPLDKAQLEQVKKLALEQAQAFGMKPDEAKKMTDALIGSLALSS